VAALSSTTARSTRGHLQQHPLKRRLFLDVVLNPSCRPCIPLAAHHLPGSHSAPDSSVQAQGGEETGTVQAETHTLLQHGQNAAALGPCSIQ